MSSVFPIFIFQAFVGTGSLSPKKKAIFTYAPLNHFSHVRKLADASYRGGGSPNQDTLYSLAWVDVSKEPFILSHPDMGERYFTFELASIDSDNFDYVGKRTTGETAGSFAIIGPDWNGTLPAGVKQLQPSRTPTVLIFGRTLVDGQKDLSAVNALQDQFTLIPLSLWVKLYIRYQRAEMFGNLSIQVLIRLLNGKL